VARFWVVGYPRLRLERRQYWTEEGDPNSQRGYGGGECRRVGWRDHGIERGSRRELEDVGAFSLGYRHGDYCQWNQGRCKWLYGFRANCPNER